MKSFLKSELARAAGVSTRTFQRWLSQHSAELESYGLTARAHLIPAPAVHWICREYGIEEEGLQN